MAAILCAALLLGAPPPGSHPVGFEVVAIEDASRPLHGTPRPIQMSLWYPAQRTAAPTMRFREYVALAASELGPASPEGERTAVEEHAAFLRDAGRLSTADVERWLQRPMRAVAHAAPLAGSPPLVLVAQGNGNGAADQAVLCELLASHGFLVATAPSPTRIAGPMKSERDIARTAEDQALDLAAIAKAAGSRTAAGARPAMVGHSFGARSALLFAMREGASALVSLDGGIGVRTGSRELRSSRLYDRNRARMPVLHIYEELDPFMAKDFSLLRSLAHADRWIVRASHLHHVHFTYLGGAVASFPPLAEATKADAQTGEAYDDVLRTALAFLEAAAGEGALAAARIGGALGNLGKNLTLVERLPASER